MVGRIALGAGAIGASLLLGGVALAGSASATTTCSCPLVPETASASSLPFTGFDTTEMAMLGLGALATGGGLLLMSRRGGKSSLALTLGGAALTCMSIVAPFGVLADAAPVSCACPSPASATVAAPVPGTEVSVPGTPSAGGAGAAFAPLTGSASGATVLPVVPESPYAVLVPGVGITLAGAVLVLSHRRRSTRLR